MDRGYILSARKVARLFPFENGFDRKGNECQQREKTGHCKSCLALKLVVQTLHSQGHGLSAADDIRADDANSAEFPVTPSMAKIRFSTRNAGRLR